MDWAMFIPLLCILLFLPVPALDTNGEESSGVDEPSVRGTKLKCTNPPGRIGKSFTRVCLKKTCTRRGKIAFWKKEYTRKKCCNYDQKWFKIGENVTQIAPDNCTIVHVHCVKNKKAAPKIRMDTTHTCVYDEKEEATIEPHCCPQVIVDGVPYQLNKSTENIVCPSSCVYGSNNSSQLFCLDSTANKSLCMASKHPKGNRGHSGCAEVYWDSHFYGLHITIPESSFYNLDNANGIGPWNDEISSWKVSSGCSLTVYEAHSYHHHNGSYGGQQWAGNTGDNPWIGSLWNDRISSLSCTCPDWYPILDCYTGLALTAISPDKGTSLVTKTITRPPSKNQLWMMDSEGTVYNYESGLVIDGAGSRPSMQPPLPITSSKQWMVRTDIRSVQETEPETVPKLVENGRLYGLNTGNRFLTRGSPVGMYNAKEVHPDNACWKTSFAEGKSGEELDMFKELLSKHKWTNSSSQEERKTRFLLWKTRKDEIDEHNKLYAENKTTYRMAENMFTIMFDSEFEARYKGLSMPKSFSNKKVHRQRRDTPQTGGTKDWRVDGRVTMVQNQGQFGFQCGSCWAFSATGAIEAAYGRHYGSTDVVDLSESNLINCMDDEYTCEHGSNPLYAFKYVSEYSIATEDDIPYEAEKKSCQTTTSTNFQLKKIKSWVVVRTQTEAYLQETVETVGPVSVLICAKTDGFRGYTDGIFDEAACSNDCEESGGVDHAVLVVGYGEENNKPYWLVKNSWGTEWGEEGYIRMARNENNQCGIASYATYPLLEGEAEAEAESVVCDQTTISEMFDVTVEYDIYCCDSDETKVCTGTECIDACRTVNTTEPCVVIVNHHHQPHCQGNPEGSTLVTLSRSLCKMAVACPAVGKQRGCSCCTKPYFKNTKCKQGCSNCATGAAHYGILIAGGSGARTSTEVFLPGSGKTCAMGDLPDDRYLHTIDTVSNTGVLCGGGYTTDTRTSCLQFNQTSGNWSSYATTLEERYAHSSWVSPEEKLVLMGGSYSGTTTEIVNGGMDFTLVKRTERACSIQLGSYTIITGGRYSYDTVVSKYNFQGHVGNLPSMLEGRWGHACGSYQDGGDTILVVAGGRNDNWNPLVTTEMYILGSSAWTYGQPLPRAMYGMASVSLDQEVIIMGGYEDSQGRSEILSFNGVEWTEVGQLGIGRYYFAATTILVDHTVCG